MKNFRHPLLFLSLYCLLTGCATRKYQDLAYLAPTPITTAIPKLNVFVPRHPNPAKLPILLFIHGGNWNSGTKNTYVLLGRNFAKKGVITIIPDYTLSPLANYDQQTQQIAAAIQWTITHAAQYGGDPQRIYITGHSAGGHLAALAVMNPKYGIDPKTIAGIILNDAAGLDMQHYLEEYPPTAENNYDTTWTNDPKQWHNASPIYFITKDTPPIMMYVGDKTYASIKDGNRRFLDALHPFEPTVVAIRLNKAHIPMVLQYFWPFSNRFGEVKEFMEVTSLR